MASKKPDDRAFDVSQQAKAQASATRSAGQATSARSHEGGAAGARRPGMSRRDFLAAFGLAAAGTVAGPVIAHAEEYHAGDWSADGEAAHARDIPPSAATNASSDDGTYRVLNGNLFPADDASPILPLDPPSRWDFEADVVVVGAGAGGLNAAARAAELGARVICLESMKYWGGNGQEAGMCGILGGMKKQDEVKFALPEWPFDPMKLTKWAMDEYHYSGDPKLIYLIASRGAESLEWMADCGVEWRLGKVPVYVAPKNATLDHHVLKMKDATDAMKTFGDIKGVDFHFNAPANALYRDASGRIVGVQADTLAGPVSFHATRAVILTAGGFCNNAALLEKYIPSAAMGCGCSYLTGGELGECFRMGLGVGADVSGFNSSASFDGGVDWASDGGTWAHFLYDGMEQFARQPWFTIDRCGNRIRYMDSRVEVDGASAIYALGDLATIQMTPPGHRSYIIMDSHYADYLEGFGQEHCRKLITPDLEQIYKVPEHYRDWHHGVEDAIAADVLKKRDTLEQLEADLGFAPGVLTEAVAKWNACCEKGEDDFMYPMPSEWLHPIKDPPFYGCRIAGNLYGTKAGLLINDEMQVVGTDGKVIPGLYAGWHTAGGAVGENSYTGDVILGSLMGDVGLAFCGGYLCGDFAVKNEMGEVRGV